MRSPPTPKAALLLAVLCLSWNAAAVDIWRCGNVYTDQPCANGQRIGVADDRDPHRTRDADNATRDARTTADRMEVSRRRLEATGARNRPSIIDNAPRHDALNSAAPAVKLRKGRKESLYGGRNSAAKKKSIPARKKAYVNRP